MCVAFPGRVIAVDVENQRAQVDFAGNVVPVNISLLEVQVGDYVLVHAGMALQKMAAGEALELQELFAQIDEAVSQTGDRHE